jgi:hypothetical protein
MMNSRNAIFELRHRLFAVLAGCAAALVLLTACSSSLLVDARDQQAKTQSPRLALSKADGSSLSSGDSYGFGPESVGGTLSAKLTIKNSGANDLSIGASGISITPSSGTGSGIFTASGSLGLTVAAGGTTTLTIAFSPTAASSYGATLTIASNDITQPSFTVKISGSGSATAKAMTSFGIQSPAVAGTFGCAALRDTPHRPHRNLRKYGRQGDGRLRGPDERRYGERFLAE